MNIGIFPTLCLKHSQFILASCATLAILFCRILMCFQYMSKFLLQKLNRTMCEICQVFHLELLHLVSYCFQSLGQTYDISLCKLKTVVNNEEQIISGCPIDGAISVRVDSRFGSYRWFVYITTLLLRDASWILILHCGPPDPAQRHLYC